MTVYEKIKALLELNTLKGVVVVSHEGRYRCCFSIKNNGKIRCGGLANSIKGAVLDCTTNSSCDAEYLNTTYRHDITPIPHKPKILPLGTKVRVLDIVKDIGTYMYWEKEARYVKCGTVTHVYDSCEGVSYKINDEYTFPACAIVPDFVEDNTEKRERIARIGKGLEELKKGLEELKKEL